MKKQDPKYFNKGLTGTIEMTETGAHLALRALGWGTLYAVTGCGILFYSVWKISGAKDVNINIYIYFLRWIKPNCVVIFKNKIEYFGNLTFV